LSPGLGVFLDLDSLSFAADRYPNHREATGDQPLAGEPSAVGPLCSQQEREIPMPDEKIDQKRPAHAESEPKPIQQRHVDDAVDDSFPASDPPAWTTSASKSVAAECEPEALNAVPVPSGVGLGEETGSISQQASQASGIARDIYRRGQTYMEQGRRYLPEAERFYRERTQAISRPVQEHPLTALVVIGALGCALGWMLGHRLSTSAATRQWHPGSNRRPGEPHPWHPSPRAARHARHFPAANGAEAASHTNNSF
jgi:ElaB/YqjD/DUF883 family membrane-anchored ribosome-binding protein